MSLTLNLKSGVPNYKPIVALTSRSPSPSPGEKSEADEDRDLLTELDEAGGIKFRSPIPCFSRSLALQYRGFHEHYSTHTFADGTRKEAGSRLVTALLEHYFPKPKYKYLRLDLQESLIQSVPAYGTLYWVVTLSEEGSRSTDTAPTESLMSLKPSSGNSREKSGVEHKLLVLLVAVVTQKDFLGLPERYNPSNLKFAGVNSKTAGAIQINGVEYRQGNVVILGGKPKPFSPSWEFYNVDVDSESRASLSPWFGQLDAAPNAFDTNMFSLATEETENVDRMFRGIASKTKGSKALSSDSSAILEAAQIQTSIQEGPKPPAQSASIIPSEITDDFLRSLKVIKTGRLQGEGGRFIGNDMAKVVRRVAKARGIKFEKRETKVRTHAERQAAKAENGKRVSMSMSP